MATLKSAGKKTSNKARSMPGIVYNEIFFNPEKKSSNKTKVSRRKKSTTSSSASRKKQASTISSASAVQNQPTLVSNSHSLLWLGVTSSLVIILAVIGWSLKVQFGFLDWQDTHEKVLLDKTTHNWREAFTAVASESESDLQTQIDKLDIQDTIAEIISSNTPANKNILNSPTPVPTSTN